jgi:hypothetical protein
MAATAQYSATPKVDNALVLTADSSLSQPAVANTGIVFTAGALGSRIDNILLSAIGTTVAGQLRLFITKGIAGKTISSITSSTTTATVTTATAHGLTTGDLVTIQGCSPIEFNVKSVAISVVTSTSFTYQITSVSSASADVVGYYATTRPDASIKNSLLKEITFGVITPSATTPAFNTQLSSFLNPEILPILLPAGFSLRATVSTTQTSAGINVTAIGGDF